MIRTRLLSSCPVPSSAPESVHKQRRKEGKKEKKGKKGKKGKKEGKIRDLSSFAPAGLWGVLGGRGGLGTYNISYSFDILFLFLFFPSPSPLPPFPPPTHFAPALMYPLSTGQPGRERADSGRAGVRTCLTSARTLPSCAFQTPSPVPPDYEPPII